MYHTANLKTKSQKVECIFVLGGPGSGKGTNCAELVKNYGMVHISAGDLLRQERDSGSEDGNLINDIILQGKIVPVTITIKLIKQAIAKNGGSTKKFLIDGFPRNQDNMDGWNTFMGDHAEVKFVLFLDCSEETMMDRINKRSTEKGDQKRNDDNMEVLRKRFANFQEQQKPIIDYFDEKGLVKKIDASKDPEAIFKQIKTVFDDHLLESQQQFDQVVSSKTFNEDGTIKSIKIYANDNSGEYVEYGLFTDDELKTSTELDMEPAEEIKEDDTEQLEAQLGPFVASTEEQQQMAQIQNVEITSEDIELFNVPQYFQEIFDKYGLTEKGYDLKLILSDDEKKVEFLEQMKKEIDEHHDISRLTKEELLMVIKSSYSPILFATLAVTQFTLQILNPQPTVNIFQASRFVIFIGMTRDAIKLAGRSMRSSKDKQLYEELVTEIESLQTIVGIAKLDSKFGFEQELEPAPKYWPFKSSGSKKEMQLEDESTEEKYWPFKEISTEEIQETSS